MRRPMTPRSSVMSNRSSVALFTAALLVGSLALGCASDTGTGAGPEPLDVTKGDTSRFVCPASVGGAFSGFLNSLPPGIEATLDNLETRMWGVEVQLEAGEGVGVWVRGITGDLDPELVVKGPSNETLGDSYRQSIVIPGGAEDDGAIVFTAPEAGRYFFLASPWAFASSGHFYMGTYPLSGSPVDLAGNSPSTHAYADALRERESEVADELAAGTITEGDDGRLVDERNGALADRARIGGLVDSINEMRTDLAREHLAVAGMADSPDLVAAVVKTIGEMGVAARAMGDVETVHMDECN